MTDQTTTTPPPAGITVPRKPIALDPTKVHEVVLLPLAEIRKAAQFVADAEAIVVDSIAALKTADELASTIKALETTIDANIGERLKPIKELIAQLEGQVKAVTKPLEEARRGLAARVVEGKGVLGYAETTHCYTSTVDELRIVDADMIPRTVTGVVDGKPVTFTLLKPDEAEIKRAIKAKVHVDGVYKGKKTQIGVRGAA